MHAPASLLLPLVAAEKSHIPFYIAGGLLALWAVVISVGIGMRMPDFPRDRTGQRLVILISVVLVAATMSTAVITSGGPAKAGQTTGTHGGGASTPAAGGAAPTPGGSHLDLATDPGGALHYDKQALRASAGKVSIALANGSPIPHNVVVAQGTRTLGQTPIRTGSSTLSLQLAAGTYTFYCAVPGHRQAGMQGTLTVG